MRAGDFGEVCAAQGGEFDSSGMCSVAAGQIWDPYSGITTPTRVASCATHLSRSTTLPAISAPAIPRLPANLQPTPGVTGNLIDPIAQKMMTLFPQPNYAAGGIYQNWVGSGSRRNYANKFDIKIDHRFTQNNFLSGKFATNAIMARASTVSRTLPIPVRVVRVGAMPTCLPQRHTHVQSNLLMNVTLGFTRGVWHFD